MREAQLIREASVDPADITLSARLRPVTEVGIAALTASVKADGGIRNAVHLRQVKALRGKPAELRLIAGAYRVAVAKALNIQVPAKIWTCTDDQAAMMEIDDQVAGRGLDALDLAVFLGRRKAVFERINPHSKAGVAGARARHGDATEIISFASVTAEQFGMTERHVRNFVRIGETLSSNEISDLRRAEKPLGVVDLLALAKIGSQQQRAAVCRALSEGKAKTVSKALCVVSGAPIPLKDPVEEALQRLLEAWERAPMAARRTFAAEREGDLAAILDALAREAA